MIQRVQSLFLLAISILMITFLFLPIWEKEAPTKEKVVLTSFKASHLSPPITKDSSPQALIIKEENTIYIGALAILAALTALFSIFQFKNRLTQIKLGFLNSLLMSGILGSIFLGIKTSHNLLPIAGNEEFQIGFFLPIIALLLNLIANRFIRKDEELVRSVDRIR